MFKKINKKRLLSYCIYFLLVSSLASSATLSRYLVNMSSGGDLSVAPYAIDSSISTSDETSSSETMLYIGDMNPGDEKSYTFTVKNYKETVTETVVTEDISNLGEDGVVRAVTTSEINDATTITTQTTQIICGVDQNYTIEITTTGNIPLSFSLVAETEDAGETSEETQETEETNLLASKQTTTQTESGEVTTDVPNTYITSETLLKCDEIIDHDYTLTISWASGGSDDMNYIGEVDKITIVVNAWQILETESETEQA